MNINDDVVFHYLNLPWTYTIEQAYDRKNKKLYIIWVNEFPEVCTDAPTLEEAFQNIQEALTLAIEMYIEAGEKIPIPIDENA